MTDADRPGANDRSRSAFHVRVDDRLLDEVDQYMAANEMTKSQAIRVLLAVGLEDKNGTPDGFRALAFREGLMLGHGLVKKTVLTQLAGAFNALG